MIGMIGIILIALGIFLLTTNRIGRRWDSPEAQRQTKWIASFLLIIGALAMLCKMMFFTRVH